MFILIASNNSHKVKEIDRFLKPIGIKTLTLNDLGITESPEETGDSFQENAIIKAKKFFELSEGRYGVLSDDSGLCVDILEGKPGIFSARYGGENISSHERNRKLLEEIEKTTRSKKISISEIKAKFITNLCFYEGENSYISIEESLKGIIKESTIESENNTFGYDPIFYPSDLNGKNLAQLKTEEKNLISARGKALQKLSFFFKGQQKLSN